MFITIVMSDLRPLWAIKAQFSTRPNWASKAMVFLSVYFSLTDAPCRWYALAPLGPFISRAYRLIEFSFACVFCPTTADAVIYALTAPSDEGAGFCKAKDWGRDIFSLPPSKIRDFCHLPRQREASRCGGIGHCR